MPDVRASHEGVEAAEQAAAAGDLTRAEALLREAAALQEAEVGPLHPDLASTFNNLAVVCEMADKPADAEQFYRRAHAIAAAALGPGHALVTTSLDNLRAFCQTRGLPLEDWAEVLPAPPVSLAMTVAPVLVTPEPAPIASAPTPRTGSATRPAAAVASPTHHSIRPASLGAALIFVALAAVAVARVWLTSAPAGDAAANRVAAPGPAPASAPERELKPERDPGPDPNPDSDPGPAVNPTAPVPATPSARVATAAPLPESATLSPPPLTTRGNDGSGLSGVRVVTATACRSLSPGAWRCEPAGATTSPGAVAFYTRVASPEPILVRHRWYRDDRLRHDVALRLGVNVVEGYRTFSRKSVGPGAWRLELRAENDALLGEVRFVVP